MVQVILITLMILLYTMQSLFSKMYTDRYPGDQAHSPEVFCIVCSAVVTVVSLFFSGFSFGPFRWETLLLGALNALILYGYDQFIIKASTRGPYSIMMVFALGGGIVMPAVVTVAFLGDEFYWLKLVAIVAICVAIYLVSKRPDESASGDYKGAKLFIPLCAALALVNGLYGVLFDLQGRITGEVDKQLMVIYTFVGSAIIAAVKLAVTTKREMPKAFKQTRGSLLFLILSAIVSALGVNVLVITLGAVDTDILYTFDNAGVMLLSALASALIFKDKLTKTNIVGCIIMVIALILVGGAASIQPFIEGLFV